MMSDESNRIIPDISLDSYLNIKKTVKCQSLIPQCIYLLQKYNAF